MWSRSSPVDGFRLAFDRFGTWARLPLCCCTDGPATGMTTARLFRYSTASPTSSFLIFAVSAAGQTRGRGAPLLQRTAQASSIIGLIKELGLSDVVIAGYDVGSRVAQSVARMPDLVQALYSPPRCSAPAIMLTAKAQGEFWYQAFHQLPLAAQLIDGNPEAVREYLGHFWSHWSGPNFRLSDDDLDRLASDYALPGAFTASIAWYRAGAGMIAQSLTELPPDRAIKIHAPTDVLWPQHDPLFPREWADKLQHYFTDVRLHLADDAGHFTPLECPDQFAELILIRARPARRRLMASAAAMVCLAASSNCFLPSR